MFLGVKGKNNHFASSDEQPEVGAVICIVDVGCCWERDSLRWGLQLAAGVLLREICLLLHFRQQGEKKKARFPEAKRFMPLLFSFTSVTKPARGLNRDEVRCDRKKKNDKLQLFFVFTLWI